MYIDKNAPLKIMSDRNETWIDHTDHMIAGHHHKLKIVCFLMFLVALFIGLGFYLLLPLHRTTEYVMVLHEEGVGSYLIQDSQANYEQRAGKTFILAQDEVQQAQPSDPVQMGSAIKE